MKTTIINKGVYAVNGTDKMVQRFRSYGNGYGKNYDYWSVIQSDGSKYGKYESKKDALKACSYYVQDDIFAEATIEVDNEPDYSNLLNYVCVCVGLIVGAILMELL